VDVGAGHSLPEPDNPSPCSRRWPWAPRCLRLAVRSTRCPAQPCSRRRVTPTRSQLPRHMPKAGWREPRCSGDERTIHSRRGRGSTCGHVRTERVQRAFVANDRLLGLRGGTTGCSGYLPSVRNRGRGSEGHRRASRRPERVLA
jgi:hypothetical protein